MSYIDILLEGKEAVLFDVDGTLIDSMGVWGDVDEAYLKRHNKPMPENLSKALAGLSILETANYFREVIGIDDTPEQMLKEWNELAFYEYRHNIQLKPGALQWLQLVKEKGLPMAVGTSNTRMLAMTALETHGIDKCFDVILTGEDVVKGKPDPYIYLTAAEKLGVDPKKCIVFEDIPEGVMAAVAAGMKVCAVQDDFSDYRDHEKRNLADYYITNFEDIFNDTVVTLK